MISLNKISQTILTTQHGNTIIKKPDCDLARKDVNELIFYLKNNKNPINITKHKQKINI